MGGAGGGARRAAVVAVHGGRCGVVSADDGWRDGWRRGCGGDGRGGVWRGAHLFEHADHLKPKEDAVQAKPNYGPEQAKLKPAEDAVHEEHGGQDWLGLGFGGEGEGEG